MMCVECNAQSFESVILSINENKIIKSHEEQLFIYTNIKHLSNCINIHTCSQLNKYLYFTSIIKFICDLFIWQKYIIQIWTCDEGNMEFYGSEATILTEAKLRSILLPKIHKTHIGGHHSSIFALLYVKCLWFKHIGLWIHILLDSP